MQIKFHLYRRDRTRPSIVLFRFLSLSPQFSGLQPWRYKPAYPTGHNLKAAFSLRPTFVGPVNRVKNKLN